MNLSDVCGTVSSYNSGCHCPECREAIAAYKRDRKKFSPRQRRMRLMHRNWTLLRDTHDPVCPECEGEGFAADMDGDPIQCPECLGGEIPPATADDVLASKGVA